MRCRRSWAACWSCRRRRRPSPGSSPRPKRRPTTCRRSPMSCRARRCRSSPPSITARSSSSRWSWRPPTIAAGMRDVAPFRALAEPLADLVRPMPYPEIYPPEDESYHPLAVSRTMFMDHIGEAEAATILEHLAASDAAHAGRPAPRARWRDRPGRPRRDGVRASREPDHGQRRRLLRGRRRTGRDAGLGRGPGRGAAPGRRRGVRQLPARRGRGARPGRLSRVAPGTAWPRSRLATTRRTCSGATRTSRPRPAARRDQVRGGEAPDQARRLALGVTPGSARAPRGASPAVTTAGAFESAGVAILFVDDAANAHDDGRRAPCRTWRRRASCGSPIRRAAGADINRDSLWPMVAVHGLRPITQVAIDETWSALRFRPLTADEPPFTGGR